MHPIHDVDALLLLSTALAAKRRPAELAEIIAAADLIQGAIPPETRLGESFYRLTAHGLLSAAEGRFALTPAAVAILAEQPKKGDAKARILPLKDSLAAYTVAEELPGVELTLKELGAAILAHRAAGAGAGKNLLVPKKAPDTSGKGPGFRQRKPLGARRRKD